MACPSVRQAVGFALLLCQLASVTILAILAGKEYQGTSILLVTINIATTAALICGGEPIRYLLTDATLPT